MIIFSECSGQCESCWIAMKTCSVQEAGTRTWVATEWGSPVRAGSLLSTYSSMPTEEV